MCVCVCVCVEMGVTFCDFSTITFCGISFIPDNPTECQSHLTHAIDIPVEPYMYIRDFPVHISLILISDLIPFIGDWTRLIENHNL